MQFLEGMGSFWHSSILCQYSARMILNISGVASYHLYERLQKKTNKKTPLNLFKWAHFSQTNIRMWYSCLQDCKIIFYSCQIPEHICKYDLCSSFPEFKASYITCILPDTSNQYEVNYSGRKDEFIFCTVSNLGFGWVFCLLTCLSFKQGQVLAILIWIRKPEAIFYSVPAFTINTSFSPPK